MPLACVAIGRTGVELLQESLPDLQYDPDHATTRPSLPSNSASDKSLRWERPRKPWDNFHEDVRKAFKESFKKYPGSREALDFLAPPNDIEYTTPSAFKQVQDLCREGKTHSLHKKQSAFHAGAEHIICGEEKGVEACFNYRVLNVVTAVAKQQGLNICGANFMATSKARNEGLNRSQKKLPDFAGIFLSDDSGEGEKNYGMRFCGEAKGDFRSHPDKSYLPTLFTSERIKADQKDRRGRFIGESFARWAGQIGNYMLVFKLKYGFLTTYVDTVFLKMEVSEAGVTTLCYSPAIKSSARSVIAAPGKDPTVSVREAMWFLMLKASDDDKEDWKLHGNFNPELATLKESDKQALMKSQQSQMTPQAAYSLVDNRAPQQPSMPESLRTTIRANQQTPTRRPGDAYMMDPQPSNRALSAGPVPKMSRPNPGATSSQRSQLGTPRVVELRPRKPSSSEDDLDNMIVSQERRVCNLEVNSRGYRWSHQDNLRVAFKRYGTPKWEVTIGKDTHRFESFEDTRMSYEWDARADDHLLLPGSKYIKDFPNYVLEIQDEAMRVDLGLPARR